MFYIPAHHPAHWEHWSSVNARGRLHLLPLTRQYGGRRFIFVVHMPFKRLRPALVCGPDVTVAQFKSIVSTRW